MDRADRSISVAVLIDRPGDVLGDAVPRGKTYHAFGAIRTTSDNERSAVLAYFQGQRIPPLLPTGP